MDESLLTEELQRARTYKKVNEAQEQELSGRGAAEASGRAEESDGDAPTVFITKTGKSWGAAAYGVEFLEACQCSGIAPCGPHTLRHTFPSRLVMAGVDLRPIQELLGHKTIATTLRYTHLPLTTNGRRSLCWKANFRQKVPSIFTTPPSRYSCHWRKRRCPTPSYGRACGIDEKTLIPFLSSSHIRALCSSSKHSETPTWRRMTMTAKKKALAGTMAVSLVLSGFALGLVTLVERVRADSSDSSSAAVTPPLGRALPSFASLTAQASP